MMAKKMAGQTRKTMGRIHQIEDGLHFIVGDQQKRNVPLAQVIEAINDNPDMSNKDILSVIQIRGLKPADIETARLYIHRFGSDLANPLDLPEPSQRVLMLDECTPPLATVPLSRAFGWSTHVEAEGLAGKKTPDIQIWEYATDQNFAALVTRDRDFLGVLKYEPPRSEMGVPFLIYVTENVSVDGLVSLFTQHAGEIGHIMRGNLHKGCGLSAGNGCRPLF
ncbi:MAG: DUF5615 family PIN-like protein [Alphaproteobacteria bacterium]|nr:DUF5615 family PIN-like protein [Alphaproteobacteria bacterium]